MSNDIRVQAAIEAAKAAPAVAGAAAATHLKEYQKMNRALDGMSRALFDSDLIASRLALFLAEALWAIMLFWPGDTFDRPTYSEMAKVAPELVWATAFGISAVLQICIVIYRQCDRTWAHAFACWNAALWCSSVVLMLKGVYPPPAAIGGEVALAVSALWIAIRPSILQKGERHAAAAMRG